MSVGGAGVVATGAGVDASGAGAGAGVVAALGSGTVSRFVLSGNCTFPITLPCMYSNLVVRVMLRPEDDRAGAVGHVLIM